MKRLLFVSLLIICSVFLVIKTGNNKVNISTDVKPISPTHSPSITPTIALLPKTKILENEYHIYQTFNNCGPAAFSMTLSYYGINKSQQELGQDLRPYQNPEGNNDDKSVTLDELGDKAKDFNLIPFHRPNGSIDLIKRLIMLDIPIITRTTLTEGDDIGHYRVVKGYDDVNSEIIQDDSLQGHNLRYSYSQFMNLWKTFNYEYLVLVPKNKEKAVQDIMGEDFDLKTSWKRAADHSRKILTSDPNDIYAGFNLSVALYNIGDFKNSVLEFEKVESRLPPRTLWYQIEPIEAYFKLGDSSKVFLLTDGIFNNQNSAFSELYIIRGEIYKKQGNLEAARTEFEKAVYYNQNLKAAKEALRSAK